RRRRAPAAARSRAARRQIDTEGRAFPVALDADRAAVGLDDRAGDVEPEPRPGDLPSHCSRRAEETVEQPGALVFGDPDSGVRDLDPDRAVPRPDAHVDVAALRRELD